MTLSRTWFEPCEDCEDDACNGGRDCKDGEDRERTLGFDYTREQEDRHNDPRRR